MKADEGRQLRYGELSGRKEAATTALTNAYVKSIITVEEFEADAKRIEEASSLGELEEIVDRLPLAEPGSPRRPSQPRVRDQEKILVTHSSKRVSNELLLARNLEISVTHSSVFLDYSRLAIPEGEYELHFQARHSSCHIKLPEGVAVEDRTNSAHSSVGGSAIRAGAGGAGVVFRLYGDIAHSSLRVSRPSRLLGLILEKLRSWV